MENKKYRNYWLISVAAVLAASFYPLYMGVRVVCDMIADGTVMKENYPKYIIPYTPVALALILGVLLMPLFIKAFKRFALVAGGTLSIGAFFGFEMLLENKVVVMASETVETVQTVVKLEDWQMYMCYIPPQSTTTVTEYVTEYKTKTAVEILMGDYNPADTRDPEQHIRLCTNDKNRRKRKEKGAHIAVGLRGCVFGAVHTRVFHGVLARRQYHGFAAFGFFDVAFLYNSRSDRGAVCRIAAA